MYLPDQFAQKDQDQLVALVRDHPLGTVITQDASGLVANHIPFQWKLVPGEGGSLVGHVARSNDIWKTAQSADVLVIFGGPQAYISPNRYPSNLETHRVVPTYNYAVVHMHGPMIIHDDKRWLLGVIGTLTKSVEEDQERPWRMAETPDDYLESQLAAIVGIEVRVTRVVGKWKMSQNRTPEDQEGAISGLRALQNETAHKVADTISRSRDSRGTTRPT